MEENKVKIGEKYKCIASPRYTCFKIGDTYEIKDEFEAELISLCRDCFTLDKESEDEKVRQELTTFLINFNNGYYSKPSEDKIDSWIKLIDKKCKQKPTDEVKPKFNVGDWVVYNRDDYSREIIQVYDIRDGRYYFTDNIHFSWSIKECDEKCHLWTIQDANDGDVLATKKGNPFIYDKDRYNNGLAYYYAGLDVNKELTLKSPHHMLAHFGELHSVSPATKEQRDLLFQKMKEAGYEWNAEKKELEKIEQKPDWSEEDERILNKIQDHLREFYVDKKGYPYVAKPDSSEMMEYNWLKSIKDKMQPQPKKEWSKEDSERLLRIHQFIWANRKGDTDEIYQQEQDADWLMLLIPQQNQYDKGYEDGYSAAKYNQWKPTDKQMEDFRMLLDYNIGVFDYAKFMSADSLYEDLKKNLID